MEKMFEMMIKSFGFNPDDVKTNITNAAIIFKQMAEQLNRIEQKLDRLNPSLEKVEIVPYTDPHKPN